MPEGDQRSRRGGLGYSGLGGRIANNLLGISEVLTSAEMRRPPREHLGVLDHRAGRLAIGKALSEMGMMAQGMFLAYFAGHGVVDPDTGELFLAMPETDPSVPLVSQRSPTALLPGGSSGATPG